MQDYIETLLLPLKGDISEDRYEVEWTSSDMFDKFYLILSRHPFTEFDEDASSIDIDGASLHFIDEEHGYKINLEANYEDDKYTCVVEKL